MQPLVYSLTVAILSKPSTAACVVINSSTIDAVGGAYPTNQNELNRVTYAHPSSRAWNAYTTTSETGDKTGNSEKWVLAGRRLKRRRMCSDFGSLPSQFRQGDSVNSPATGLQIGKKGQHC